MTWLVIGSNSFSGASFCEHLLKTGQEVVGTSRSEEIAFPFRPYGWREMTGSFNYQKIDLNHDLEFQQMDSPPARVLTTF